MQEQPTNEKTGKPERGLDNAVLELPANLEVEEVSATWSKEARELLWK